MDIDYDAEREDFEIQISFNDGKNEILPFNSLSDGSKSILTIVADIAYRMAVLNPYLLGDVIQKTDGIVLIDEIDMHLHPSWQRRIIGSLRETFSESTIYFYNSFTNRINRNTQRKYTTARYILQRLIPKGVT